MTPGLRVRLVADHIDHGGALHGGGRSLLGLTHALLGAGVDAEALVVREPSELGRELLARGEPLRFLARSSYDPRIAVELASTCRREGVDVLHLTDFAACTWGRLAARSVGTATVVHVRSHHSPHQPRGFPKPVEWAYRLLAPLTDRTIAISQSVRDFAVERMGFDPARIEVLHNPLSVESFEIAGAEGSEVVRERHGIAADAPVVGTVTRFHAAKGIRYLVDAFPAVMERHPDAVLVLVGEGPEEGMLRERARELGIGERVVFAGYRDDPGSYYALFDVLAMPSIEEGFGNVAVEAMAAGTPVVASDLGGLREIVTDGVDGVLVPAADAGALGAAVANLLDDPARRGALARAGRERAGHFGMEGYLERLLPLYEAAVEHRRQGAGVRGAA